MRIALGLALIAAAVGCESPIVGAKCQTGFTRCGEECVNTQRDFRNCGECDHLCHDFICLKGACEEREQLDAAISDAAPSD